MVSAALADRPAPVSGFGEAFGGGIGASGGRGGFWGVFRRATPPPPGGPPPRAGPGAATPPRPRGRPRRAVPRSHTGPFPSPARASPRGRAAFRRRRGPVA